MQSRMLGHALVLVCLTFLACGEETDDVVPPDADRTPDGAVSLDAPPPADASATADAPVEADAGKQDATAKPDALPKPDGGTKPDAGMLAGGETCGSAVDVTTGGTFAGTTATFADDLSPPTGNGCPSGGIASGKDVVYFVEPTAQTTYKVTVFPESTFDPMLYVMDACNFGNGCLAGTVLNGEGVLESVTFTVGAGERQHIAVDGELGSSGSYTISVTIQ